MVDWPLWNGQRKLKKADRSSSGGHLGCSSSYNSSEYQNDIKINTQAREQTLRRTTPKYMKEVLRMFGMWGSQGETGQKTGSLTSLTCLSSSPTSAVSCSASEVTENVGDFARGGGGKKVFILSEDPVEAHSGKLWHCQGCGKGFPTKTFFDNHIQGGCQLYQGDLLIPMKKCVWRKQKNMCSFPYGAPGGKAAKQNGFPKKNI